MEIINKNLVSIICGVIILLAVIVKFAYFDQSFDKLKEEGEQRVQVAGNLKSTLDKTGRVWPKWDPNQPQAKPLGMFPSDQALEEGKKFKDRGEFQARQMFTEAISRNESNHHWLHEKALLPTHRSEDPLEFRESLRTREAELTTTVVRAVQPPSHDEMEAGAKKIWDTKYEPLKVAQDGKWSNEEVQKTQFAAELAELPAKMRYERALNTPPASGPPAPKIYIDAGAVPSPMALDASSTPDSEQIWYAQMAYWMQYDLLTAIHNVNLSAASISDSPIKRLKALEIDPSEKMYVLATPVAGQQNAAAAAQLSTSPNPALSILLDPNTPSGRCCNPLYDVAQFNVTLDIQTDQIEPFLANLSSDKFLTVLDTNISPVEYDKLATAGYLYGNKSVVELRIHCEELFLRQWTVQKMPAAVRKLLGISDKWTPAAL